MFLKKSCTCNFSKIDTYYEYQAVDSLFTFPILQSAFLTCNIVAAFIDINNVQLKGLSIYCAAKNLFQVNNKGTGTVCEFCSKFSIMIPKWYHFLLSVVYYVKFKQMLEVLINASSFGTSFCLVVQTSFVYF